MLLKRSNRSADIPVCCIADIRVCDSQPRTYSNPPTPGLRAKRSLSAFTLIEVMIACGIFFMATFAILALVASSLRNARALQRGDVDAGMAAAQIFQLLKTNRQADISGLDIEPLDEDIGIFPALRIANAAEVRLARDLGTHGQRPVANRCFSSME